MTWINFNTSVQLTTEIVIKSVRETVTKWLISTQNILIGKIKNLFSGPVNNTLLKKKNTSGPTYVVTIILFFIRWKGDHYIITIIWSVRPCEPFLCKTIDEGPVWGPYAFARAGLEKAVRPYYKSTRPRVLKLQENLSPNWSYDKILFD